MPLGVNQSGSAWFRRGLQLLLSTILSALVVAHLYARTWQVRPDGTGDARTIQAGLDTAARGDTVLVAPGTYFENPVMGYPVCLMSESGPEATIVDGSGLGRVLMMTGGSISGFTIVNGQVSDIEYYEFQGGGIYVPYNAEPVVIRNNIITNNFAPIYDLGGGGGVFVGANGSLIEFNIIRNNSSAYEGGGILASGPRTVVQHNLITGNTSGFGGGVNLVIGILSNNVVVDNLALYDGGGVWARGPCSITNNTVVANRLGHGGGGGAGIALYLSDASMVVSHNIASRNGSAPYFERSGAAIHCSGSAPIVNCNVLWQNDVDAIVGCAGDSSNARTIVADPMFCEGPSALFFGPYSLDPRSPATSPQSGNCGHIGALSIECRVTTVTNTDWTRIKLLFR